MVAAPTGTGKTVVAEYAVYTAFRRTGRVIYTTPIKALSNQKFRDLRQIYGDQVGLLTGDVTENKSAQVVVMTTEVLRNMLLQTPWDLDDVDTVIFDEIHFLADPERGTTWEEAIILCPEHVQLVCLSATVSNAEEIAGWIGRTHRPIRLVTHYERAVPLSLYYFVDSKLQHGGRSKRRGRQDLPQYRRRGAASGWARTAQRGRSEQDAPTMDEPLAHEIVDELAARDMLPAIYFLFSRNDCQVFAERLAVMRPGSDRHRPRKRVSKRCWRPRWRRCGRKITSWSRSRSSPGSRGAASASTTPACCRSSSNWSKCSSGSGLMQVVFATDTLALGVNMPARSVVIGRMSKWDGRRRRVLIPNEFQQMAGRAGRRGMDAFGHVVVPYSPWLPFREMLTIATGPLEPVRSAFAVRYNTVLNLWDPPHGDRVRNMLQQSLAQFQAGQRIRQLEDDIIEIGGDIIGFARAA